MTPQRAARLATSVVLGLEADRRVPVLQCKLATPRQRYSCRSARRLTAADLDRGDLDTAEWLTPGPMFRQERGGDLWTIEAGPDECRNWA